jgi:hypothetical protein
MYNDYEEWTTLKWKNDRINSHNNQMKCHSLAVSNLNLDSKTGCTDWEFLFTSIFPSKYANYVMAAI